MRDDTELPGIRVNVYRSEVRKAVIEEPDIEKWPIDTEDVIVVREDEKPPGLFNTLLGTVEVPGNSDLYSMYQVLIPTKMGVVSNYLGVAATHDGHSVKYVVPAKLILEIASKPEEYEGLGISVVSDQPETES